MGKRGKRGTGMGGREHIRGRKVSDASRGSLSVDVRKRRCNLLCHLDRRGKGDLFRFEGSKALEVDASTIGRESAPRSDPSWNQRQQKSKGRRNTDPTLFGPIPVRRGPVFGGGVGGSDDSLGGCSHRGPQGGGAFCRGERNIEN